MNNNQALIDGLRQAADFLEARPDFPGFGMLAQHLYIRVWDKAELVTVARHLGSFEKKFTDNYFELHRSFGGGFRIEVCIDRESVCKKIVTWDCPDDESLLKLVSEAEAK